MNVHKGLSGYLDPGEATSIALATEYKDPLLIIDEIKGRKVAKQMGVKVTGSLGVLISAKNKNHGKSSKANLKKIRDTNFRVSKKLIEEVLKKANEA